MPRETSVAEKKREGIIWGAPGGSSDGRIGYKFEGFFVLDNQSGFSRYKSTVCEL